MDDSGIVATQEQDDLRDILGLWPCCKSTPAIGLLFTSVSIILERIEFTRPRTLYIGS
jgi:hypothetical protein